MAKADAPAPEVLAFIGRFAPPFPGKCLRAVRERRAEFVPALLERLRAFADDPERDDDAFFSMGLYALIQLAEFREREAAPFLLKLARHPADALDELLGDYLTEDMAPWLHALVAHDPEALRDLAADDGVQVWVRVAALDVLAALAQRGDWPTAALHAFVDDRLRAYIARAEADGKGRDVKTPEEEEADFRENRFAIRGDIMATAFAGAALDAYFPDLLPLVERAFDCELIDPMVSGPRKTYRKHLAPGLDESQWYPYRNNRRLQPVSAESDLRRWTCYQAETDRVDPKAVARDRVRADIERDLRLDQQGYRPVERPVHAEAKPSPNAPCSCGSGKKYKRCCGR